MVETKKNVDMAIYCLGCSSESTLDNAANLINELGDKKGSKFNIKRYALGPGTELYKEINEKAFSPSLVDDIQIGTFQGYDSKKIAEVLNRHSNIPKIVFIKYSKITKILKNKNTLVVRYDYNIEERKDEIESWLNELLKC